jgi:hypothetical protein
VNNGDERPAPRAPGLPSRGRAVLAGLLILVVLAGIRAARPSGGQYGPWHNRTIPLAALTEAALGALLLASFIVSRRRPAPGYPAAILRQGLRRAIGISMVAVVAIAWFSTWKATHALQKFVPGPRGSASPKPARHLLGNSSTGADLAHVFFVILIVVLLAAIAGCVLVLVRHRWLAGRSGYAGDDEYDDDDDDDEGLRRAVASGRSALRAIDDARAAIIACYSAMETSLAGAGSGRAAAETPDELLARSVRSGLLRGDAAAQLTALFYEARFSSHAVPPGARDQAEQALSAISAELAGRAATAAAAQAPAAGARP